MWPKNVRPQLVLATSAGLELVYRSARFGEAAFLLRDGSAGCVVSCVRRGADAALSAALQVALSERARALSPATAQHIRRTSAWLRDLEDRASPVYRLLVAASDPSASGALGAMPDLAGARAMVELARGDRAAAIALADDVDEREGDSVGRVFGLLLAGRGAEALLRFEARRRVASPIVERAWAQLGIALERWTEAFRSSRAALDPENPSDLLACARLGVLAGDEEWVARAARRVIDLGSLEQRHESLALLVAVGHEADALAIIQALSEADPRSLLFAARVRLWLDEHDRAEEWLARVHDDRLRTEVQRARGGIAVRRGELDRALELLLPVLDAMPRDRETTLWIAEALLRAGRTDEASAILHRFDKAVTGEHPIAKLLLGLARLEDEHRLPGRERAPGSTLYIHRNIAADVLGRRFARGDIEIERAFVWEAIDAFGGNRSDELTLLERGHLRPARHVLDPRVHFVEAQHRVRTDEPDLVVARLAALGEARPDVPYARTYAAELDLWRGLYERAAAEFRRAWEETGTRWGYVGWGASLVLSGRPEEGIAVLDEGVRRMAGAIPGEATPAYRGEALRALGRLEEAAVELSRAVDLRPARLGAWASLALTLHALGEGARALEAASRFAAAAPVLIREARKTLGLDPALDDREDRFAVLERALALMKGNRSSYLLTFFDAAGRFRVMPTHGHFERMAELAERSATAACISALEEQLARQREG